MPRSRTLGLRDHKKRRKCQVVKDSDETKVVVLDVLEGLSPFFSLSREGVAVLRKRFGKRVARNGDYVEK